MGTASPPADGAGPTWVFHRGALGDSVLLWPMLRRWQKHGPVTLVSRESHAQLAARWLGVDGVDAEQPKFNELWINNPGHALQTPVMPGVAQVFALEADPHSDAGRVWLANAAAMFPGAETISRGGRIDRLAALELTGPRPDLGTRRANPGGPIVLHVGAGSRDKRWPLARWAALVKRIEPMLGSREIIALAGEVEAEQFDDAEREIFASLAPLSAYLTSLDELSGLVQDASVLLAADTGPGHLAAALGVTTISLFGPTDPARWSPLGVASRVIAPNAPRGMEWLAPGRVMEDVSRILGRTGGERV